MSWLRAALAVGIVVALVDALAVLTGRGLAPESDPAQYIAAADQIVNVALFSLLGYRVGKATRVARTAAEAGVLAGAIAGSAAVLLMLALPAATAAGPVTARDVVGTLALNVAMGGLVSLANGWLGSRAEQGRRDRPS